MSSYNLYNLTKILKVISYKTIFFRNQSSVCLQIQFSISALMINCVKSSSIYLFDLTRPHPITSEFMEKTFQAAQLTHERFLTVDHSCKIFFWYLPNWTSTDLWCVVLYVAYSTTHQRLVEVQFGRYQKNILQEWSMVKKLSCASCGSLKRFPHTFTTDTHVRVSKQGSRASVTQ